MSNVTPDIETLGSAIESLLTQPLLTNNDANLLVFPDGDFEKTGRAYSRRQVIFTIASQTWTPPPNPASTSRGGQSPQGTTLDLIFYIQSVSLRGPQGVFGMKKTIEDQLRGLQLDPLIGVAYPSTFAYSALDEKACRWEYIYNWSINHLEADPGKKNYQLDQSSGQPVSAW